MVEFIISIELRFLENRNNLAGIEDEHKKRDREIEKTYTNAEFVEKLRRLADAIENDEKFEIQIASERIYVPVRETYNIEHEREDELTS